MSWKVSVELFMQNAKISRLTQIVDTPNDLEKATEFTSAMLQELLESISTNFITLLFSALIQNTATTTAKNRTTPLQLALRIIQKMTLKYLDVYQVTSTYNEVRRLKKSVTVHYAKDDYLHVQL